MYTYVKILYTYLVHFTECMLYLTFKNNFLMIVLDINKEYFVHPKENSFSWGHIVYSVFLIAKEDQPYLV